LSELRSTLPSRHPIPFFLGPSGSPLLPAAHPHSPPRVATIADLQAFERRLQGYMKGLGQSARAPPQCTIFVVMASGGMITDIAHK